MIEAIKHNLANLTNFSGRDKQSTYWWYVLFLFILWVIAYIALIVPVIASAVGTAMEGAQAGVDQAALEAQMESDVFANMRSLAISGLLITVVMTLLIAASLVRRARDAGLPNWLGWAPIVANLVAAALTYFAIDRVMSAIQNTASADIDAMMQVNVPSAIVGDLLGWVAIIAAIVIGAMPTKAADDTRD